MSSLQDSHLVYQDNPGSVPATYVLPGSLGLRLESIYAEFDGSGAASPWLACLELLSQDGKLVGRYFSDRQLGTGDNAHVTWAPFLGRTSQAVTLDIDPNMGELGRVIGTTLSATQVLPVDFQSVEVGDQIMVMAFAPSVPSAAAPEGTASGVTDTGGNAYYLIDGTDWEDGPPAVNTGIRWRTFFTDPVANSLAAGSDSITVTWDNPVYDRNVFAWLLRYPAPLFATPTLGQTGANDSVVQAQGFITQGASAFFPGQDKAFEWGFALIAYPSGAIGFSGHPPYTAAYLYDFRLISGSKQQYFFEQFTYQADVYTIAGNTHPVAYNDIIGLGPASTTIPANLAIGQNYSVGVGNWKGASITGFGA